MHRSAAWHVYCGAGLSLGALPFNSSLYMAFTADSFRPDDGVLMDLSGRGRNATLRTPSATFSIGTNTSALTGRPYAYLQGTAGARILLPAMPPGYTLFHIARNNGARKGRILAGSPNSADPFLSGFDNGGENGSAATGVARRYQLGWITPINESTRPTDGWLLSTDQHYMYRSQGLDRTLPQVAAQASNVSAPRSPVTGACINCQSNVSSDWALAALVAYSRELSLYEMMQVEDHLAALYDVPLDRVGTPCEDPSVLHCAAVCALRAGMPLV